MLDRSAEEIRRSEKQLARIVALAADAIICVDGEQRITLFNEGAQRTFGYAPEDILGKPLSTLIPQRYHGRHGGHFAGVAGGAPMSRHMGERQAVFALRSNGEEFPADASISKIIVEGEAVFTVVLRDVTDRVQAEETRRLEGERLRLAMDAGRLGGFEYDQQADKVRLFGHAASILGLGQNECPVDAWFALVHPDDAPRFADTIRHAARGSHQVEMEYRIKRSDNTKRWIRAVASSAGGGDAWPRLFGTIQDITEQKALQQVLEERVAERTEALESEIARREQAQGTLLRVQRMEAYGQLTGGIAHDFNNLLTVIGGNLELVEGVIPDDRSRRMLRRAIDAVEMGSRLTSRLLSFARRSRLEPEVLNLNDQVIGVIDLLRRTIGEVITISSGLEPNLGRVKADPSEIENAILNLAINARDAMPQGGKLVIETANATVEAGFDAGAGIDPVAPGPYVRLSVSDTGAGMTPEVLSRAFEPFFTTKEPGRGTGLGLASIYGFARQSNGTVTIQSESGRGTTVNIYLPRIDARVAGRAGGDEEAASPAALPEMDGAGRRMILLVEDNQDVREITHRRLEMLGYDVALSASGPEAVAYLAQGGHADLVFSDVVMPGGMSGYDVVAWVEAHRPGLPCLLTSGFAEKAQGDSPDRSRRILRKPYATADLASALAEALGADA